MLRIGAGVLAGLLGLAMAAPAAVATGPTRTSAPVDPSDEGADVAVDSEVTASVESEGKADFWIYFENRADLSPAYGIADWTERGQFVVDALQKAADASQARVRAELEAQGATFTPYWVANAIKVESGSASTLKALGDFSEIASIEADHTYTLPEPVESEPDAHILAVEWGIADINADDVWSTFGVRGEGVTVASIDSGVQYDHPAVVGKYRGNLGGDVFDHNYNWFDPSNVCGNPSLAPCDNNDHGTHTMGTMVGDDGAGNQVGVAPGARWITAKGCEARTCSENALLASGQWLLAPTDLQNQNPDVSKRPHVINNSWGGDAGGDTWYQATVVAWRAAGMFPTFSNGNAGPSCSTVGAPGSYAESYGVGNYTQAGRINAGSSRGPSPVGGVGVKPDISAPGTNVRSSIPDDGYANFTGTSMAAPHVSGAVALMWSAAPALEGDIDGTIAILDETARDAPDAQCGGEPGNNNVFGEGRLDALAAVDASPRGPTGTVTGTVTDATTGGPIAGAEVIINERSVVTADDGTYSLTVEVGTYEATASAYGYATSTQTVDVAEGATIVADFALEPLPITVVSGTVTDGGGHGWPIYARVAIDPYPGDAVFTDPDTGEWSVELPDGGTYTLTVTSEIPGYDPATAEVTLPGPGVADVALKPDDTCSAPGYDFDVQGVYEVFETGALPDGWENVDHIATGEVWTFNDPGSRGNLTGGAGGFAIVDSDEYGPGATHRQDTSLVTPRLDLTGITDPVIRFKTDYNDLSVEQADVDLSIDGGATWTTVRSFLTDFRGPQSVEVPIPAAANDPDVKVRFHYHVGTFDWWWEVDEVFVSSAAAGITCGALPGGLVSGNVLDEITTAGLHGATVTAAGQEGVSTTTRATPEDPDEPDGYYTLFSPATGAQQFTAHKSGGYVEQTKTATVAADALTVLNFALGAGRLTVTPASVETDVELGFETFAAVVIRNRGTQPASFELTERDRGREILNAAGAPVQRIPGEYSPTQATADTNGGAAAVAADPSAPPWVNLPDYPNTIQDNGGANVEGIVYSIAGFNGSASTAAVFAFNPETNTWTPRAAIPTARSKPAVGVIDGQIYVASGWAGAATPSTVMYDPAADAWSARAAMPAPRGAGGYAVLGGQLYVIGGCDPATCTPVSAVHRYDPAADTWTAVAPYPVPVSWQSCGALGAQIVCAGGITSGSTTLTSAYAYDATTDSWSPVASLPQDMWGSIFAASNGKLLLSGGVTDNSATLTNEGFVYDPAADTWTPLPNSNNTLYRSGSACGLYRIGGDTGGTFLPPTDLVEQLPETPCDLGVVDVPWLSAAPTSGTLLPNQSRLISLTLDASVPEVDQPGTYGAELIVSEDTPYAVPPVGITLEVTPPPAWGKLAGSLNGLERCDAPGAPLRGATVTVEGALVSHELETEPDGTWKVWLDEANNPVSVTFSKDGWVSETVSVDVVAGDTVTVDEALRLDAPCAGVEPDALELSLPAGTTASTELTLTNAGAAAYDFRLGENAAGLTTLGGLDQEFSAPAAIGPMSVRSNELTAAGADDIGIMAPPWMAGPDVPGGIVRYAHAACDNNPNAYFVIGGVNTAAAAVDTNRRYDPATNSYNALAPMPEAAEAPFGVCAGGVVHVLGGEATNSHFVYDPATDSWSTAAAMPRGVWGAGVASWDGKIYVAGGDNDFVAGGTENRVDVYDITADTWSAGPPMPVAATAVGYAQVGNHLYVVGGWGNTSPGTNVAAVQRLDLTTGVWTTGPNLVTARGDLAVAATDTAIYAIGGDTPGGNFFNGTAIVTRLATASWPAGTWQVVDPLPANRTANSAGFCTWGTTTRIWNVGGAERVGGAVNIKGNTSTRDAASEACPTLPSEVLWLSVDPADGTVDADSSETVTVTVDANGLTVGSYSATLVVATSDPAAAEFHVPVEVEVTPAIPEFIVAATASGPVGGVTFADEDLITLLTDDSGALAFDGSDVGLAGFALDAAARLDDGSWALSFTTAGTVPGVTGTVDDSDLVRFVPTSLGDTTAGTFSMWFDASDLSLNTDSEDIDAVDVQADGSIVFSTSGSFLAASGLTGRDVDLVLFEPTSLGSNTAGTLSILFDGRDVELNVAAEDVDALAIAGDGSLALSSVGALSVTGLTATAGDVTRFVPTQLGSTTTGTWDPALVLTGAGRGITDVTAFEFP